MQPGFEGPAGRRAARSARGMIARINETNGSPVGFINAKLYAGASAFNDVTQGNNGDFAAGPGWDACTGLGSPDGVNIAALFETAA